MKASLLLMTLAESFQRDFYGMDVGFCKLCSEIVQPDLTQRRSPFSLVTYELPIGGAMLVKDGVLWQ